MPFQPVAGWVGDITIGSVSLNNATIDVSMPMNVHRCPYFGSWTPKHSPGLIDCTITITGVWDAAMNPFDNGIQVGSVNTATCSVNNVVTANYTYLICQSWGPNMDADGDQTYTGVFIVDDAILHDFGTGGNQSALSPNVSASLGIFTES